MRSRWTSLVSDVRELLGEQVEYRELLYQMTKRDLLLRYKQTAMGFGWAVLMPIINTIIFSVIFTRVARVETGMPYPIFAYTGLVAWNFLASSLRFSATSLSSNPSLVTKVYFPREIFPFSSVIVSLVDAAVAGVILLALMAWYGVPLTWAVLWVPVVVAANIAFVTGLSLILAMANLFYRDVKYIFEVVLAVWMFATSVVYPVDMVKGVAGRVLALNPMTPLIDAFRDVLLRGRAPSEAFWAASAVAVAVLAFAWVVFHRAEFTFAENV